MPKKKSDSNSRGAAKRKSKDSVFVKLFSEPEYVLQLYKDLHPKDVDVKISDIRITTLDSVVVNTLCNDLGFTVRDKLIMLVEAQSVWDPNISLRLLFYLAETYRRYLDTTNQSEHGKKRVDLPKPELFVVYSGTKEVSDTISLSKDFFGGTADVELKAKVLKNVRKSTVHGQYIGFCKVFDEQRQIYNNKIECSKETVRICIERGYLAEFMKKHESEVITMLEQLFDEEYLRRKYDIAEGNRRENLGIEKGKALGRDEGIILGRNEGIALGRNEGITLGRNEGITLGRDEGKFEMIFELLKENYPLDKALKCAKMSYDDYKSYLKKNKQ